MTPSARAPPRYVPPTASITARGDAGYATLSVDDPASGDWWTARFAARPARR